MGGERQWASSVFTYVLCPSPLLCLLACNSSKCEVFNIEILVETAHFLEETLDERGILNVNSHYCV